VTIFIGQVEELRQLIGLSDLPARDGSAAALITGDPGCGKSRLLAEAEARIRIDARFRVAGFEAEQHVPLAATAGLLRDLAGASHAGRRLRGLLFEGSQPAVLEPLRAFEAAHQARSQPSGRPCS
jgi:hypothetical protein